MPRIFHRLGSRQFNRCANERGASCSNDALLVRQSILLTAVFTAMCDDVQIFGGDSFKNSQK